MSRRNNVNPDHYKTAGRLRQGEEGTQELEKQQYTQAKKRAAGRKQNLIPGAQTEAEDSKQRGRKQ